MKYPLTEAAKQEAKRLVEAWDGGQLDQMFELFERHGGDLVIGEMIFPMYNRTSIAAPKRSILSELAQYKLIHMQPVARGDSTNWEVLLLQELRNTVQNDFEVSEFFLTTSAIGTIVQGNLVLHPHSVYQSIAAVLSDVDVNFIQTTSDQLEQMLGSLADQDTDLRAALDDVKVSTPQTLPTRLGSVVKALYRIAFGDGPLSEMLTRSISNTGNAASALGGIVLIAKLLTGQPL